MSPFATSFLFFVVMTVVYQVCALPPGIPSAFTARSELRRLKVDSNGTVEGYDRDLFPHWITISGTCNTRETVLARDGTEIETGANCAPTKGHWVSEYDGLTFDKASGLDIDHVVPLANAWKSGASKWDEKKRKEFANDLKLPQLIAVSARSNRQKGMKGPEEWVPPLASFHCTYAKMYTRVKFAYELTVNGAEKKKLLDLLSTC